MGLAKTSSKEMESSDVKRKELTKVRDMLMDELQDERERLKNMDEELQRLKDKNKNLKAENERLKNGFMDEGSGPSVQEFDSFMEDEMQRLKAAQENSNSAPVAGGNGPSSKEVE